MKKRDATPEEIDFAISRDAAMHGLPSDYVRQRHEAAIREGGYKAETCECGATALAHHHFTICRRDDCPFKAGGMNLFECWNELAEAIEEPADG